MDNSLCRNTAPSARVTTPLGAQAKVTEAQAIAAVQAANPGSTVTVEELDGEGGKVIYDLKVQPADGSKAFEAAVDAVTGELLTTEAGD